MPGSRLFRLPFKAGRYRTVAFRVTPLVASLMGSTMVKSEEPGLADDHVNILLVDDRPDKLLALETVLAGLGQHLVLAHSGTEALRHLLKQEFALIVLDVSMPGMDGFETASLIRQRSSSELTPI